MHKLLSLLLGLALLNSTALLAATAEETATQNTPVETDSEVVSNDC